MSKKGLIKGQVSLKRKQTDTRVENKKKTKEIAYIPMEIVNEIMGFYTARIWWFNVALVNKEWRDTFLKFAQREKDFFGTIIKALPDAKLLDTFGKHDPCWFPHGIIVILAMVSLNIDLLDKYVCHDGFLSCVCSCIRPAYVVDNARIEYNKSLGGFRFELLLKGIISGNIPDKITMTDVTRFYLDHISNMIRWIPWSTSFFLCFTMEPIEKKFLCAYITKFYNIHSSRWDESIIRDSWTDLHNEVTGLLK